MGKSAGESSLHQELKRMFVGDAGRAEARIGSFICDGLKDDGTVIEIQLGSFAPLRRKIEYLSPLHPVDILHPVIRAKEIYTFDTESKLLSRRHSPKKGNDWDLFRALVHAPLIPLYKNVCIQLVYIDVHETRVADGGGSWRRKGVSIGGRSLLAYHGSARFCLPEDYRRFVPFAPDETWTVRDFARAAGIRRPLAQKAVYVLSRIKQITQTGKKGNAGLWQAAQTGPAPKTAPEWAWAE